MVNIRYILAGAVLAGTVAAQAKDLKTEITVDRTVVPVERQATRLGSVVPELYSPAIRHKALGLYEYGEASEILPSISRLEPMNYGDTLSLTPYRGYASVGYFPAFNLGASAGYRLINKASTRLGAWLQYDGYSYKDFESHRHDYDKLDGSYKNNTVALGLHLDQRVGSKSRVSAGVTYSFAALTNPFYDKDFTQNRNDFAVNAAWWSRAGRFNYHVNVDFDRFAFSKDYDKPNTMVSGIYKAAGETLLGFKAGLAYAADGVTPAWGLELAGDFLNQSAYGLDNFVNNDKPGTHGIISLSPYYAFNAGEFHGRVGLKVDFMTGDKDTAPTGDDASVRVAPDILIDYNATSQFAVFARISGGENFNTLRTMSQITPFIPSWQQYGRSNVPVTVDAGFNIGPFKGFAVSFFGGYAVANDWMMPARTGFLVEDVKGWHVGLKFDYSYGSLVEASASVETAASGDQDKAYYLWRDRAKWAADASVTVRPIDKLSIDLGYKLRAQRSCYNLSSKYTGGRIDEISLGNVSDLSLGARYAITDAFSVFARGENLLNHRYDIISGVAAQGLKGLLGVSLKF